MENSNHSCKQLTKGKKLDISCVILGLWVFCSVSYLTYRMTVSDGVTFGSDYVAHILAAIGASSECATYSLMSICMKLLYSITGNTIMISLFMGALVCLTGLAIRRALTVILCLQDGGADQRIECSSSLPCLNDENRKMFLTFLSFSLLFLSALYIPERAPFYLRFVQPDVEFLGSLITQPWHNSTYIAMRLFAILSFLSFVQLLEEDSSRVNPKSIVRFFVLLLITNLFKPNFVIAFAPAAFLICLIELIHNHGKGLVKYIWFGVAFLASLAPILYQYVVLFSSNAESSIIFSLSRFWVYVETGFFPWLLISNLIFPLIVTVLSFVNHRKNNILLLSWILEIITFFEMMFLTETGPRAMHGNFTWGMYLSSLILFICCIAELIAIPKQEKHRWAHSVAWCILLLHLINGFMYFGIWIMGGGFGC
ncbi:MAG: hypothetical protein MSH58_06270 [Clostridiales bacterium]|nr:hypothetical protein [Clostridiales bacterium]